MATISYIAKVQDKRLLELPEEANLLGLEPGDEVEVSVRIVPHHGIQNGIKQASTPQERASAFRAWAEGHSRTTPLLSDDAVSRESFYGERG
jgi:hypothetical protein